MTGALVATTVAAVEQTGQTWVAEAFDVRSVQKWSWAPRKTSAKSIAKIATL